jgi:hypothetical protein
MKWSKITQEGNKHKYGYFRTQTYPPQLNCPIVTLCIQFPTKFVDFLYSALRPVWEIYVILYLEQSQQNGVSLDVTRLTLGSCNNLVSIKSTSSYLLCSDWRLHPRRITTVNFARLRSVLCCITTITIYPQDAYKVEIGILSMVGTVNTAFRALHNHMRRWASTSCNVIWKPGVLLSHPSCFLGIGTARSQLIIEF